MHAHTHMCTDFYRKSVIQISHEICRFLYKSAERRAHFSADFYKICDFVHFCTKVQKLRWKCARVPTSFFLSELACSSLSRLAQREKACWNACTLFSAKTRFRVFCENFIFRKFLQKICAVIQIFWLIHKSADFGSFFCASAKKSAKIKNLQIFADPCASCDLNLSKPSISVLQ